MTNNAKILLVDDEQNWRDLIKEILEKEGYNVETAESGDSALELIDAEEYHLVITDIRMETEFRGIEVLEYIKKKSPITPVIMLTAYSTVETAKESLLKGATDFFVKGEKGSSNDKLREKVAEALEKREKDKVENFDHMVLHKFPSFISEMYYELKSTQEPMEKLKTQIELFELILKFSTMVVLCEYFSGKKRNADFDSFVQQKKRYTRSLSDWYHIADELYNIKDQLPNHFFLEVFSDFFKEENRELMSVFINIRNNKLVHGGLLPDSEYKALTDRCKRLLSVFLSDLSFLTDFLLCKLVNNRLIERKRDYKLIECNGVTPKFLISERTFRKELPCDKVLLIHLKDEKYQTLEPFIILEDCRKCGQVELFVYQKIYYETVTYLSHKTGHYLKKEIQTENIYELVKPA